MILISPLLPSFLNFPHFQGYLASLSWIMQCLVRDIRQQQRSARGKDADRQRENIPTKEFNVNSAPTQAEPQ
jgi:hypothetical protein